MRPLRPLAAAVTVAAVLAGCSAPPRPPAPTPPPSPDLAAPPPAVAVRTGPFDAGPVPVPRTGALVGAWVRPESLTQPGRLSAVADLERGLGRRLDIVNTYRRFDEKFGTESDQEFLRQGSTMMVSWASGDTRSIVTGRHDALIRAQAQRIRAANRPVLMRFRWEMDRPNLRAQMWSGADYIAAWRHVRQIFAEERARNAAWVWCPTAEGFQRGDAPAFYPGDDAVDWTCVDVYAGRDFRPLGELMGPFLRWAAERPKPIIIGEFGVASAWGSAARAAWLRDAARLIKANPQIKAVSYFESNPDGNGPKQQFRLTDDPPAFTALRDLAQDPYFTPTP
jgi:hypothetical protein